MHALHKALGIFFRYIFLLHTYFQCWDPSLLLLPPQKKVSFPKKLLLPKSICCCPIKSYLLHLNRQYWATVVLYSYETSVLGEPKHASELHNREGKQVLCILKDKVTIIQRQSFGNGEKTKQTKKTMPIVNIIMLTQ